MAGFLAHGAKRARELRRRVMLPARLRADAQWSDACILNISSHGLLVHCPGRRAIPARVELRRGALVIVADVVWRDGARVGLRSEERLPVEDIMSMGLQAAFEVGASDFPSPQRRRDPCTSGETSRQRARALEFVAIGLIAATLAAGASTMMFETLRRPLGLIGAVLGGPQS